MTEQPKGWEPDPNKIGHQWRSMFEPQRGQSPPTSPHPPVAEYDDAALSDDTANDANGYSPWSLIRGRSRPVMMLELRRYETRSGFWQGWVLPYPSLCAIEYMGDGMLALDFGTRKFMLEGRGLDGLARHLHSGTVATITEYAKSLWPHLEGPFIAAIKKVGNPAPEQ